ncbi:DUF1614 domain-containing protein [Methanofollis formosanus]|uniref:DUF1614 domain-containing protein n=1 Tax=Methanofollis formosanus TaxID=299308 RepID=A0A8G1A0W1_9EURY|nr:DUF1614 domain-containing protein [Methanofollis formosanus]QYZ79132.1 DUF1614 domain-containing protein [Methanofollis formosanus]
MILSGVPTVALIPIFSADQIRLLAAVMIPVLLLYLFILISEEAFELTGIKISHAFFMTFGALIGSFIDIPLMMIDGVTLAVNVGGCLVPVAISAEVLLKRRVDPMPAILSVAVVTVVSYYFSFPVEGQGILMPFYIAPLVGAASGILFTRAGPTAGAAAYIGGTIGTLIGADFLNLATPGTIEAIAGGAPAVLSIGGAGVFDGIFLTGILAVFLATLAARRIRRSKKDPEATRHE